MLIICFCNDSLSGLVLDPGCAAMTNHLDRVRSSPRDAGMQNLTTLHPLPVWLWRHRLCWLRRRAHGWRLCCSCRLFCGGAPYRALPSRWHCESRLSSSWNLPGSACYEQSHSQPAWSWSTNAAGPVIQEHHAAPRQKPGCLWDTRLGQGIG